MYKYKDFIAENIAPKNAERILVYNADGQVVTQIPLGRLKQPVKEKLYSFQALADVHIGYDTADTDFQRSLSFGDFYGCLFTIIAGDLTVHGTESQFALYQSIKNGFDVREILGNHDSYDNTSKDYQQTYTGKPLYYSFTQGDDVFIMVGHYGGYRGDGVGWVAGEQFSDEELQWLYETLEANRNKRCFVIIHVFPWGGSGNALGAYTNNMWTGTRGTVFENLMKHYPNVTVFHAHSHLKYALQALDKTANYSSARGYRSIHIASNSVPRDIINGSLDVLYAESEGYIVDVYDDYIILNGMDFIDNDNDGTIIPLATYKIDTTLVNVPAGTFVDNTGIIQTS